MKNYTSLSPNPHTDYMKFTNDKREVLGGLGGLGGLGDILNISKLENYETLEKREINGNSYENSISESCYFSHTNANENVINKELPKKIHVDAQLQSIVVPFYIPILDIIISHDLRVDIVDHSVESTEENKSRVICGGNIRKYRVNGDVKDYNIIIEMENDALYHVRKRGIMMRTNVGEELRKHIIKTMVKYADVDQGEKSIRDGDNIEKQNAVRQSKGMVVKPKKRWFQFMACFTSTPDS
jgi:hypothetical protein